MWVWLWAVGEVVGVAVGVAIGVRTGVAAGVIVSCLATAFVTFDRFIHDCFPLTFESNPIYFYASPLCNLLHDPRFWLLSALVFRCVLTVLS